MATLRSAAGLIRACHPEPTLAVTVGTTALALAAGRGGWSAVAVALAVLASQLAVGWHNDWLDAGRDATAGRLDKPIASGMVARRTVGAAAVVAAVLCPPLALISGRAAAVALTIGLVGGLAYNWPLKSTAWSVLPYVVSFSALPAFVLLGRAGAPTVPWWLVAAGGALGAGAHFANVLPDFDDDARTGVHGLPHRLGRRGSTLAATVLLVAASVLLVFAPTGTPSPVGLAGLCAAIGVLGVGGYAQLRRASARIGFRAVMLASLIDIGLLLAAGRVH